MISEQEFDALKWHKVDQEITNILNGAFIEGIETIWAGYTDSEGKPVILGLVLYITDNKSHKKVLTIEAPENDDPHVIDQLKIQEANIGG